MNPEPVVTQAMMDYAIFMEQYVEPLFLVIYFLAFTIGPAIATLLNVVMGLIGWFTDIAGTFQIDNLPPVD